MIKAVTYDRFLTFVLACLMFCASAFGQSRGDVLFNKGMQLQSVMTISSQKEAIRNFDAAKKIYDSNAKKSQCDKAIAVSRNIIAKLSQSPSPIPPVPPKPYDTPVLDLSNERFDLDHMAKTLRVNVNTNARSWKVAAVDNPDGSSFLTVRKAGNSAFEIICPENRTESARTQTVAVTISDVKRVVTVTQSGNDAVGMGNAEWLIKPSYESITRYAGNVFAVSKGGKWGLVDADDREILPANYDFISDFTGGAAMAIVQEGSRYRIDCIVTLSGSVSRPSSAYYLPPEGQYFSEGKMAVANSRGKYGYIDMSGNLVVGCQFDMAYPFKDELAPVRKGNYMQYITSSYDSAPSRNILPVDFHYGEMTRASCFVDGTAVVAYNDDCAVIDKSGKKRRKISKQEFQTSYKSKNSAPAAQDRNLDVAAGIQTIVENGSSGLKSADGRTILPARLDKIKTCYADGITIAESDGKWGVLKLKGL